jgi:uncharacterized protein
VQVVLTRIHELVGNTFMARMHLACANGGGPPLDVDARPSDAINMAVRFQAPLFVSKKVAAKMAVPLSSLIMSGNIAPGSKESNKHIERSCKEECALYKDPTVMKNLQLGLAVKEQRYEDAGRCRPVDCHHASSCTCVFLPVHCCCAACFETHLAMASFT